MAEIVVPAVPPATGGPDRRGIADRETLTVLALALVGGGLIGLAVAGIRSVVGRLQALLFGADVDAVLSASVAAWRMIAVPTLGGLVLGGLLLLAGRFGRLAIVDPVEANALEGGRMSIVDSLVLVGLSVVSIAIGGSVGFEAAMTQLGAGCMSAVGQRLRLSRRALRILVACGTGAGISAIFDAPLAGTLYAIELVIGGYAVRALLPTLVAAASSGLVTHLLFGAQPMFLMTEVGDASLWHFALAACIGLAATGVGIVVMRGTTVVEQMLVRGRVPSFVRPAVGGLALGLIALAVPQVLGPGHNGIDDILSGRNAADFTASLLLAKAAASIVCVGAGFRGGLFSASLFLGAALGCVVHGVVVVPLFGADAPIEVSVAAGMAGVAASIVGTPIAIVLLLAETAGLQTGIVTVAIAVAVASQLTRQWFGFSFSTWRFHVRGRDLLGPRDIGRMRGVTLADVPLEIPPRVAETVTVGEAAVTAAGSPSLVVAVETADGRFAGLVRRDRLNDAVAIDPAASLATLIEPAPFTAHPKDALADHLEAIGAGSAGELPVVDDDGRLIGLVAEAAVLRRYLDELLALDRDDAGPFLPTPGTPAPRAYTPTSPAPVAPSTRGE